MNLAETHRLLTLIASLDNRRFGDETVRAWQEILAGVEFCDARAAVIEHFATSLDYLMPAHIRTGAKHHRILRTAGEAVYETRAIEARQPADPQRLRELLDELKERIGPGRPEALRRPEWLAVDKARERETRAEPNPDFAGLPPDSGHPLPEED